MAAIKCYLAMLEIDDRLSMMNIEERRKTVKLIEVLKDVPLDESDSEKFIRIRTSMEEKTKQYLVHFLKKSKDVFTWNHEDMPGIDLSIITHRLNPRSTSQVIKREKCFPQIEIMPLRKKFKS